jgi:bifunctional non-homologous end joining protein LigD
VAERQLEGMVAKLATSRYVAGQRTRAWGKIKTHLRQQAVIGGFTIERGSRPRLGALLLGVYRGKDLTYIGHTGSGFNQRTLAAVRDRLEPLIQETCPFKPPPKPNAAVRWVKPELVCEVFFSCWTSDGTMRHPVFQGLREDVPASSVRREDPDACKT